ncbi:hypothetical protein [Butyrivibrio proteoclasticus]|uniref:hypothetical protein n=1 Tax=Butyrivibrio proteoclasticus TaxID=43305 RepID=UPI00047B700C|nr:hypothetical protein [Butyrivibrio proteoclasticus]
MKEKLKNDIKKCPLSAIVCVAWFSLIWWLMAWTSIRYDNGQGNFFAYWGVFSHPRLVGVITGVVTFELVGYLNKFKNVYDILIFPVIAAILNVVFSAASSTIWRTDHVYSEWELGFWPERLLYISWYVIGTCVIFLAIDRLIPFLHEYLRALVLGFMYILCVWGSLDLIAYIIKMLPIEIYIYLEDSISFEFMYMLAVAFIVAFGVIAFFVVKKLNLLHGFIQYALFTVAAIYTDYQFMAFGDFGIIFFALFVLNAVVVFLLVALIDFIVRMIIKKKKQRVE